MKKLYPYFLLITGFFAGTIINKAFAQPCSDLQMGTQSFESRCMATGSIAVTVDGGSGSYNYKAIGPLTTPFTSAPTITGLKPGYYKVVVKDINTGCEISEDSVLVDGTYSDPRFQLKKTNVSCLNNDGTITVDSLHFGRAPFTYTIIAPSPSSVGVTNSTGAFTNLIAGEYFVQLRDSCGGIQVRRATIEQYSWWFDAVTVTKVGCDSADVVIRVRDNRGNVNTSGTAFTGFQYGVVNAPGDTIWHTAATFRFYIGNKRTVTIVAKDDCGNIHTTVWNFPPSLMPSVTTVGLSNFTCAAFTANVNGEQNLTSPEYCIYTSANAYVDCNYTGTFMGLAYGSYCIRITDVCYDTTIIRCFTATRPVPSVGANVGISNQVCATFTATINGQTNLTTPQYCLYDSADVVITCNSTGIFPNLAYGTYCIKTDDACVDTIITRCFTATRPAPVLNTPVISGSSCGSFTVTGSGTGLITPVYCIYDSTGALVTCDSSGTFTGLPHGTYCMTAISCGDTTAPRCFTTTPPTPSVAASVQISGRNCTGFTATITGQTNLTAPQYCLYDTANVQVSCNTTGVFTNIPYGSYCIKVIDSCTNDTITRCFSTARTIPAINGTIQQLNSTCSTFSARVTGTNLTAPQYCLYDSSNVLIRCNTTGTFDSLAYGRYCVRVQDACGDTFRVCRTFVPVRGLNITSSKSCTIGNANINVQFLSGNAPYIVNIFHPDGSTVFTDTASTNPVQTLLPALAPGLSYKIIGRDACGFSDTGSVVPDASIVTKSIRAISKCPSSAWANGSGDLSVISYSNLYTVRPRIIKKNGAAFVLSYSSNSGSTYLFNDLEPASYIVEFNMLTCNTKLYDTFALQPYSYPTQGQSAIYQCDDNSFSLGADVLGGVSPYTYQIIGSMPATPSIVSTTQTNPIFTINNGTTYSLVRLRTIDACGNATLSDLSVLPLQNISITSTDRCYYDTVTLSVDAIANSTYAWYKKRTATDSILVSTQPTYMIPFFEPEHTAVYVCKVTVNNGCLIRLSYFNLVEDCGHVSLPATVTLTGKREKTANELSWNVTDDREIQSYAIEKRPEHLTAYKTVGTQQSKWINNKADYNFTDKEELVGNFLYRLKIVYTNGKIIYSNEVRLANNQITTSVYPNPAKETVYITINGAAPADYEVALINTGGRIVYTTALKNVQRTTVTYRRNGTPAGMYLLHIKNKLTGTTEYHKIILH